MSLCDEVCYSPRLVSLQLCSVVSHRAVATASGTEVEATSLTHGSGEVEQECSQPSLSARLSYYPLQKLHVGKACHKWDLRSAYSCDAKTKTISFTLHLEHICNLPSHFSSVTGTA